ncbi:MAG: hypothetical protein RR555_06100 [Bacteroidales bacterium]
MKNKLNRQDVKWDELLDLYFSGETTLEQEQMLRDYFASDGVSVEHEEFMPLFSYMNAENKMVKKGDEKVEDAKRMEILVGGIADKTRRGYWKLAILAAAVASLLVGGFWLKQSTPAPGYELTIGGVEVKDEQRALALAQDKLDVVNHAMAMLSERTEKIAQTTSPARKLKTLQIFSKEQ